MARPQSVSDETIMAAAARVIARRGYDSFTLAEVAAEVGLSRAAIILRFKSTQALKMALTRRMNERFLSELRAQPVSRSGNGLIDFCAFIAEATNSLEAYTSFLVVFRTNIKDQRLIALEHERIEAMRAAISARMPKTALPHKSAVIAFEAMMQGAIMQWAAAPEISLRAYLTARVRDWLTLAGAPFTKGYSGIAEKPSWLKKAKQEAPK